MDYLKSKTNRERTRDGRSRFGYLLTACYGQLPRTVYCTPLSTAGDPFCDLGTVTVAVTVLELPDESVTLNVIV